MGQIRILNRSDALDTQHKLQAHIVALEAILQTALPVLLNRAEAMRLRGVVHGRLTNTPAPDSEQEAAVWAKAQELADGHLTQIVARART
jgi:hypothetical protein